MPVDLLLLNIPEPPGGQQRFASCPFLAQANIIPGGYLLAVYLHHLLIDGHGGAVIVEAWAKHCKELQNDDGQPMTTAPRYEKFQNQDTVASRTFELPDAFTDHLIPLPEDRRKIQEDSTSWQLLGLQKRPDIGIGIFDGSITKSQPPSKNLTPAIFSASPESVQHLKTEASLEMTNGPIVSAFAATAALLWRSIIQARLPDLDTSDNARSRLRIVVDRRQILNVSNDYLGNVLLSSVAEVPINSLVQESNKC